MGPGVKFLVIGLGSMGKRRIRNLHALGHTDVAGVDPRADRRSEAATRFGVAVFADFAQATEQFRPDALIIATPPDLHLGYAWQGVERGLPCFIEASVVDAEGLLRLHERVQGTALLMAPSCTMRFFPGPQRIRALLEEGVIGRPLTFSYHTGQYLPDWHPWEPISDYYVSQRATGGCREIVPFELTWLNALFGEPQPLACVATRVGTLDADIDDLYQCLLRYPGNLLASLTVEVLSRPCATRQLRIVGSQGQIVFDADEHCVRHITTGHADWQRFGLGHGSVATGYINPDEPYVEELKLFIAAVTQGDPRLFPNTLLDDHRVLHLLSQLEALSAAGAQ
jgi:predicted dehydrogenase